MVKVTEVGYMGFNVTDLNAWREFATKCVGLEIEEGDSDDRFYLRMDTHHYRFAIHQSNEDDLAYTGWRVSGREEFEAMQQQLSDAGVEYQVASEEDAEERCVLGLLTLQDPSGNAVEIFYAPQVDVMKPFHPGRPMHGKFLTGDQGVGHLIIRSMDDEAMYQFYSKLGLRGAAEYKLKLPNGMTAKPTFMSCNDRQHSLAFGLGPMEKRINHLMLEYTEFDDLGLAHDTIRQEGIDVAMQLGKHSNDQAYTFYFATPSGWLLELGHGARHTLKDQEYYVGDVFGHRPEAKGYGMDIDL